MKTDLRLPPKIHPLAQKIISDRTLLDELVDTIGTPINVLLPNIFTENIEQFRDTLSGYSVKHQIFYAHKANQSTAIVRQAMDANLSIDVASVGELQHVLDNDFPVEAIEVTGPKSKDLLKLAIQNKVILNIDSLSELELVIKLMADQSGIQKQKIVVRISQFVSAGASHPRKLSRFGIDILDFEIALAIIQEHASQLNLIGIAFHLDTNDVAEKNEAVSACLACIDSAYEAGLTPTVIDIGGGFRQIFTADSMVWEQYVDALKTGLQGSTESLSWPGTMFGYRRSDNAIVGTPIFNKYGDATSGLSYLGALLDSPLKSYEKRQVSTVLSDMLLELYIEPGKALLDHVGLTIAQIISVKRLPIGDHLVILDIKRDNIVPVDQEVMVDPVVIYRSKDAYAEGACGVYFAGNLCLERDMVYLHKTHLDKIPQIDDLVIFVNTAAYQMDLSASEALMQPRPTKVAVTRRGSKWKWTKDEDYIPESLTK
jgi:diaminopimelate decarboxylase